MNSQNFQTLPDVMRIRTGHFMLAASQVPEVTTALAAVLNAVQPLQRWIDSQQSE